MAPLVSAVMAALIAAVSSVDPFPVAPKLKTLMVTPVLDTFTVMEVLAVRADVFVVLAVIV